MLLYSKTYGFVYCDFPKSILNVLNSVLAHYLNQLDSYNNIIMVNKSIGACYIICVNIRNNIRINNKQLIDNTCILSDNMITRN